MHFIFTVAFYAYVRLSKRWKIATVEARIFYLQKALRILLESPIRDP